jgi:type IV pilus assembly protein PilN
MKITLNLATRPYADQGPALKRLRIGMAVCGGLLLLLGLGLLHFHQRALKMRAQEDAADASVGRIRQEQIGYRAQMQQPPNARVLTQAEFLNHLFTEKSFSWTAAMEDLERVLPAGEQVTSIEPSRGKDGRLTLKLRISGPRERSVELVRNMEHSRRFASPRVSGENAESGNGPEQIQNAADAGKVNFDVLAEYNPPTLEERRAEIAAQKNRPAGVKVPVSRATARATAPAVRVPAYIPPSPQPGRPQPGMRPMAGPGGVPQYASPMRSNRPPQFIPPNQQGPPTGYDPSGLRNHDRNRLPDPNAPQQQQPQQEDPQ